MLSCTAARGRHGGVVGLKVAARTCIFRVVFACSMKGILQTVRSVSIIGFVAGPVARVERDKNQGSEQCHCCKHFMGPKAGGASLAMHSSSLLFSQNEAEHRM